MANVLVKVSALALDKKTKSPYVVLRDDTGRFHLPVFIGLMEANAIAMELEEMKFPRPMTHDLLASVIRTLHSALKEVVVTRLDGNTFYATITLEVAGEDVVIDARPSDSIALALRMDAPIYVAEEVLAEAGAETTPDKDTTDAAAESKKWKEFLENLEDDDFGKYQM